MGKHLSGKEMSERGFTLIETVVAVTIFSIIGVSLVTGFSVALRGWEKAKALGQVNRDSYLLFAKIEQELRNSVFNNAVRFEGDRDKITFFSIQRNSDGAAQLKRVNYRLDNDTLQCREDDLQENRPKDKQIMSQISSMQFSYAVGDENIGYNWIGVYKPEKGLPKAVKIDLGVKENGQDRILEKIIEIPGNRGRS